MGVTKERILIIEDDSDLRDLLKFNLEQNEMEPLIAKSGEEGLGIALSEEVDLILLDVMLPGINGFEVVRRLIKAGNKAPIVMLTARAEDYDQIDGFEAGADDYVTKPFSPGTLIARIKAILRRKNGLPPAEGSSEQNLLEVHGIVLDKKKHIVTINGKIIDLSLTEFSILATLMEKPGWVFSRTVIIDASRGGLYAATERSVDVQILGLRRKLGDKGVYIETVRGVGYRIADVENN